VFILDMVAVHVGCLSPRIGEGGPPGQAPAWPLRRAALVALRAVRPLFACTRVGSRRSPLSPYRTPPSPFSLFVTAPRTPLCRQTHPFCSLPLPLWFAPRQRAMADVPCLVNRRRCSSTLPHFPVCCTLTPAHPAIRSLPSCSSSFPSPDLSRACEIVSLRPCFGWRRSRSNQVRKKEQLEIELQIWLSLN
jgi:hypothetical protein